MVVYADTTAWERSSTVRVVPPVRPRKLAKVPFVELAEGRLQGVVSSGSDIARVYVSSIAARTHDYSCSTNNNRPCGGLNGGPCKHLRALADEAVLQYGLDRVARYLHVEVGEDGGGADLMSRLSGSRESAPAAVVFSRFLRHLAYLELPDTTAPVPELHWFPATEAVG
ncbi:hypothetical protein ACFV1F_01530 [Streptomyces sp. NPDC059590]|uniref:hypothetical protein n=1 Tax=Streptomyces sp. NPDC059590 TaxID=3346877 RepID=UPI00368D9ADE